MKLTDIGVFKTINQALYVVTSKKKLKELLTTPLYANAFYLMLNTAVISILGFFFWMVVARFYTEGDVGFASAIISIISFLALLSLLGLNFSLVRFLPQAEKPEELINTCFTLSGLISLVAAGIYIAGLDFWSPALAFIKRDAIFSLAFVVFVVVGALSYLTQYVFIARRKAKFILFTSIASIIKIPLPVVFVFLFHSFGIVSSWAIATAVAVAISLFLFLPKVQNLYKPVPTLKLNLIKNVWQYSGSNYLASLFTVAPTLILPLMVVNIIGPESNAYFYIAWIIAGLLSAIPFAVSQSLFAEGSHFEDKLKENAMKSLKFTFLLLVPAVILLILVGKWLLLAFGQNYSANALKLLWILSLSSLPLGINYIYTSILQVTKRLNELMAIWGFIAVVVVLGSCLIMPVAGIIGIGCVWLGVHITLAIYAIITGKQLQWW